MTPIPQARRGGQGFLAYFLPDPIEELMTGIEDKLTNKEESLPVQPP